jgi:lipopolysaccharide transport system ATP-binding protein
MIIGVQKGGTTSLYHYLSEHPQVKLSLFKETHFFNANFNRGLLWYKAFFPINKKKSYTVGEATPCYFFYEEVPQRVREIIPNCKFIVVLRNPIERAISHYKMNVRRGNELAPNFEVAIKTSNHVVERRQVDEKKFYTYLERGLYAKQLKNWLQFFSINQFLFIKSEDLLINPTNEMDKVFDFLKISKHYPGNFEQKNAATKSKNILNTETLNYLKNFFIEDDIEIGKLLGSQFRYLTDATLTGELDHVHERKPK